MPGVRSKQGAVHPRSVDALFGLGQILAARGDQKGAMETFKAYVASKTAAQKR